jgi:hypothetical protein
MILYLLISAFSLPGPVAQWLFTILTSLITTVGTITIYLCISQVQVRDPLEAARFLASVNPKSTSKNALQKSDQLDGWFSFGYLDGAFYYADIEVFRNEHGGYRTSFAMHVFRWNADRVQAYLDRSMTEQTYFMANDRGFDLIKASRKPALFMSGSARQRVEDLIEGVVYAVSKQFPQVHAGWILAGPPGTGKSSAPVAFALMLQDRLREATGKNTVPVVASIPMNGEVASAISHMMSMLSDLVSAESPAILVIEDVDRVEIPPDQLPEILYAIDNFRLTGTPQRPHIVIFTVNSMQIPEVLIRPGRMDDVIFFGNLEGSQITEMIRCYFEQDPSQEVLDYFTGKAPSLLTGLIQTTRHMEDLIPKAAKILQARKDAADELDPMSRL